MTSKGKSRVKQVTERLSGLQMAFVIGLVAAIGTIYLLQSQAATPALSFEPESGTISAPATRITDQTASGGAGIKFGPALPASGFNHPGIFVGKAQLDHIKARLAAGAQPWTAARAKLTSSKYASTTYTPNPVSNVQCGSGNNVGCTPVLDDAVAAYTHALLWYYTGNQANANKAIQIMNAWSGTLTKFSWDGTAAYNGGKLHAGWSGTNFIRAAEIIRYSNAGWAASDITRFESMLNTAFLPVVINGWTGGGFNWMTLFADTTMSIGVFTNNKATFDNGLADWRAQVPSHVYTTSDGATPKLPAAPVNASSVDAYWNGPNSYTNGQTQESCRDLGHSGMGMASIFYAAETARLQGIDLYGEQSTRLRAMLEYQSTAARHRRAKDANAAYAIPASFCGGTLNWGGSAARMTAEVGYNHYAGRLGIGLPETREFINLYRPFPESIANLHMQWETLTHADTGPIGL